MTGLDPIAAYTARRANIRRLCRVAFGINLGLVFLMLFVKDSHGLLAHCAAAGIAVALLLCIASDLYLRLSRCPGCGDRLVGNPLFGKNPSQLGDPYVSCPRCNTSGGSAEVESEISRVS
jgi:hypothetical protein